MFIANKSEYNDSFMLKFVNWSYYTCAHSNECRHTYAAFLKVEKKNPQITFHSQKKSTN